MTSTEERIKEICERKWGNIKSFNPNGGVYYPILVSGQLGNAVVFDTDKDGEDRVRVYRSSMGDYLDEDIKAYIFECLIEEDEDVRSGKQPRRRKGSIWTKHTIT